MDTQRAVVILGCFLQAFAPIADEPPAIAIPGQYLDADHVKSGDGWWVLHRAGQVIRLSLEPTSVDVSTVLNRFQEPSEKPGDTRIAVSSTNRQPLLIVRGVERLRAGPIEMTYWNVGWWEFLKPGEERELTLKQGTSMVSYWIGAVGTVEERERDSGIKSRDYGWVLERRSSEGTKQQSLLSIPELGRNAYPTILWAGDLDRDGLPDLLVDESTHEFRIHLVLYLSSHADEGQLVGRVAEWKAHTDC